MLERRVSFAVGEFHYLHHDRDGSSYDDPAEMATRIIAAAKEKRDRANATSGLFMHIPGSEVLNPTLGQQRFVNDLDRFSLLVEASQGGKSRRLTAPSSGSRPHSFEGSLGQTNLPE